jgi:hypothetical protein
LAGAQSAHHNRTDTTNAKPARAASSDRFYTFIGRHVFVTLAWTEIAMASWRASYFFYRQAELNTMADANCIALPAVNTQPGTRRKVGARVRRPATEPLSLHGIAA